MDDVGEGVPTPEDNRPPWVIERKDVQERLRQKVVRSVTDPQNPDRCVLPYSAAVYVTNMLTVHEYALLAELAVIFAREQVEARLALLKSAEVDHG